MVVKYDCRGVCCCGVFVFVWWLVDVLVSVMWCWLWCVVCWFCVLG